MDLLIVSGPFVDEAKAAAPFPVPAGEASR
jgi:hypothetical protein